MTSAPSAPKAAPPRGKGIALAWVLAALSVTFAALWATTPVATTAESYTWEPLSGLDRATPLVLAARTPEHLLVTVPCDAAMKDLQLGLTRRVFSTTGGTTPGDSLALVVQPGIAWAEFQGRQVPGSAINVGPGCTLSMDYSRGGPGGSLKLSAGFGASASEPMSDAVEGRNVVRRLPVVTGLSADPAVLPGLKAEVVTDSTGVHPPGWRWLLGLALVGTALGSLVLVVRRFASIPVSAEADTDPGPRWALSDTLVAVAALCGLVLLPPEFDDGWVLTTVRGFADLGVFSNYYTVQAVPQPQGYWWTWLSQLWLDPTGIPAFLYRLPYVLMAFAAWWAARRWVIDVAVRGPGRTWARFGGAIVAILGFAGLLVTIRPEPLEALLLAAVLCCAVRFRTRPALWPLLGMWTAAILGFAAHQTGWAVVGAAAATIPSAWAWARTLPRTERALLLAAASAGASLLAWLLLLGTNAAQWMESAREFTATGTGYDAPMNEVARLANLLDGFGSVPARWMAYAIALLGALAFVTRSAAQRTPAATAAGWSSVAALVGLVLTASKFTVHWGAITPAAVVLAALASADLKTHPAARARAITAAVALVVVGAAASKPVRLMTPGLQEVPGVGATAGLPVSSWAFWIGLLVVAAIAARWARRRGRAGAPLLAASVATLATAAVVWVAMAPMALAGADSASWMGQQVAAVTGKPCGLGGDAGVRIPVRLRPLTFARTSPDSVEAKLGRTGVNGEPTPLPDLTVVQPLQGAGQSATAWFDVTGDLGPDHLVAVWLQGKLGRIDATVEFEDAAGNALAPHRVARLSEQGRWHSVQVSPPAGAALLRVVWNSDGGPLAVTDPAVIAESVSLADAASGQVVWNNPGTHLQAPCPAMPSIATGVIEPFAWSVGVPLWNGSGYPSEVFAVEMACPVEVPEAAFRCVYRFDKPEPSPVLTRGTVSGTG